MEKLNRLKIVLAEKEKTAKWLSDQIHKNPSTVSNWCTNNAQPSLETLMKIAEVLDVNVSELLNTNNYTIK